VTLSVRPLLDAPAGGNPLLRLAKSRLPYAAHPVWLCFYLPEGLSCHGKAPSQLWPHSDSSSGGAFATSLQAKAEVGIYLGMPYAMLEET
jgi:hypothetical protein